jgi:hypothetical protein
MIATPTLQQRVSVVEDTVKELVTSLPLPGAYLRTMHKDIGRVKQETAAARMGILDLGVETSEIQSTLREHTTTLDRHGDDLTDIKSTVDHHDTDLGEIKSTLGDHGAMLREHGVLLKEHGVMLKEHGAILKALSTTLGLVMAKLDKP